MKDQNKTKARDWAIEQGIIQPKSKTILSKVGTLAKQAALGIPAGVASLADIPTAVANLTGWGLEKAGLAKDTPTFPYTFHDTIEKITNNLAGEPKTNFEKYSRLGGDVAGALFVNPGQGLKRFLTPKVNPKKYEAFKEAGLTPSLGDVSNSKTVQIAEQLSKKGVGGAGKFEVAAENRANQLEDILNNNALLKESLPIKEGGGLVAKGGTAYNAKASEVGTKLFNKAWKGIEGHEKAPVALTKASEYIADKLKNIGSEDLAAFRETEGGKELFNIQDRLGKGDSIPFTALKEIYQNNIKASVKSWGKLGDRDQNLLKGLNHAVEQDIQSFIHTINPKATKDFAKANKYWSQFKNTTAPIANKFATKESPEFVDKFNSLINDIKKGEVASFRVASQRLPAKEKEQLFGTVINELGRGTEGFDPYKFSNQFNKLRPESQEALLSNLPVNSAKKVKAVTDSLRHSKASNAQANHSGTAYTAQLMTLLGTGVGSVTAALTGHPEAAAISALTASAIPLANYGISKLFTDTKFIDALYAASKAKSPEALGKVLKHFGDVLPPIGSFSQKQEKNENLRKAREWYKSQQGSGGRIQGLNEEAKQPNSQEATKPFEKSSSKFGYNPGNGEYTR